MRKEAIRRGVRRRAWLTGLLLAGLFCSGMTSGCGKLSEEQCLTLRSDAFEIINVQCDGCLAHTCNDDTDCIGTIWPGCIKPVNKKNLDKIAAFETKFKEGSCSEDTQTCPDAPDVYCKQGLCVFRHRPGESGKTTN
jgi:hypothetical protein